jgi:hypothetical protein
LALNQDLRSSLKIVIEVVNGRKRQGLKNSVLCTIFKTKLTSEVTIHSEETQRVEANYMQAAKARVLEPRHYHRILENDYIIKRFLT